MRLFIAIPLATEVADQLERFSLSLQSPHDDLRWSSRETWHITLQFLGETSRERYDCAVALLAGIQSPAVPIRIGAPGFFDRAGVFFAGVEVSQELGRLERLVVAATSQCGIVAEDRPYHPHVTLARGKGGGGREALRKLKSRISIGFSPFVAREFVLYESFIGSSGARHEVRQRFPLG
jgi:2'-5' RNA ligase